MRQTLPVMVVSSRAVEFQESYSASIRGRQDVDIVPQVSGRITRLCVKEGSRLRRDKCLPSSTKCPIRQPCAPHRQTSAQHRQKWKRHGSSCKASKPCLMKKVISDYELSCPQRAGVLLPNSNRQRLRKRMPATISPIPR